MRRRNMKDRIQPRTQRAEKRTRHPQQNPQTDQSRRRACCSDQVHFLHHVPDKIRRRFAFRERLLERLPDDERESRRINKQANDKNRQKDQRHNAHQHVKRDARRQEIDVMPLRAVYNFLGRRPERCLPRIFKMEIFEWFVKNLFLCARIIFQFL